MRVAFDMTHRVLVAPVTHVSPANGGLPYSPATFAKFARVAQDKVRVNKTVPLLLLLLSYLFGSPRFFHFSRFNFFGHLS